LIRRDSGSLHRFARRSDPLITRRNIGERAQEAPDRGTHSGENGDWFHEAA
jgi:hypothetical protein